MDLIHNFLWLLSCLICLKPVAFEQTKYCSSLGNSPAINVCQSATATNNQIYLDSTEDAVSCFCNLTHDSNSLNVIIKYRSLYRNSGIPCIQFEINKGHGSSTFKTAVISQETFSSSPVVITYNKTTDNDTSAVCFGIKAVNASQTFTITCYPDERIPFTTFRTYPPSTMTRIQTEPTSVKPVNTIVTKEPHIIQTSTTRPHNETSRDVVANVSTDDNSGTNIGVIAAAVGVSGGFLIILAVVTIVVCKRRRTRREHEREATIQQQGDIGAYTDLTVPSRVNTYDQIDQGDTGTYTDLTVSFRGNAYDQINQGDTAYTDLTVPSRGKLYDQTDMRSAGNARQNQENDPEHQYSNTNSSNPNYENPDFQPL